ncbi:MAG: hypothetical protein WBI70_08800, partial [Bacillota bacterium]
PIPPTMPASSAGVPIFHPPAFFMLMARYTYSYAPSSKFYLAIKFHLGMGPWPGHRLLDS